ncbi:MULTISPECIES: GNAT family N-acetyltransferase [Enterococcus]|uniref:GNAT family N-acetyltransferase n=1 Tax=Enterococcus TaxID=1350 RepID=UPI000F513FA2|nr:MULTISPECIES: GNAT family N-acetyltransferase [Enterococcus]MEB4785562.1 GNAT family N-acetyltransferase [Enterococcus sp. E4-150]ROY16678.1 GNAT family N-acetyltransferase [Enterococcus faecium]HAR1751253.1 GNAT family N-acetyltransferase [Enterococcus faecium]
MELNERVISWGMPEFFADKGIEYRINKPGDFYLIDKEGNKRFEMDFTSFENPCRAIPQPKDTLVLNWIQVVKPEDRKKGIASYYLKKLVEYCTELSITTIELSVINMDNTNGKSDAIEGNHLGESELIDFYERHIERDGGLILKI